MGKKLGLIATYEVVRVGCVLGQRPHTLTDFPGGWQRGSWPTASQSHAYQEEIEPKGPLPVLLPPSVT